MSYNIEYGIIQGRLSPQRGNFIQDFPNNWRNEFRVASQVGASHIEWMAHAPYYPADDPLLSAEINNVEVPISGICLDWLPRHKHVMLDGLHGDVDGEYPAINYYAFIAMSLGIPRIVLPYLEASSFAVMRDKDPRLFNDIIEAYASFISRWPQLTFSFETDLDVDGMYELLCGLGEQQNVGVTFDIGNLTRLGHDLKKHMNAYGEFVDNIHIKDCDRAGVTVPLGTGVVDRDVFGALLDLPNVEHITFQTARNLGLSEEDVFRYNVSTFERLVNENR